VQYIKNYEANVIYFNLPGVHPFFGENAQVRLRGVDNPNIIGSVPCEDNKKKISEKILDKILKNAKMITIEQPEKGHDVIIANVKVDGQDVKSVLLRQTLTYLQDQNNQRGSCKRKVSSDQSHLEQIFKGDILDL